MIKLGQIRVIDFQDARLGAIQYDLVSLLRDSYTQLNDLMVDQLLDFYLQGARSFLPKDFSREKFDLIFELQSVQRCFKACGSFSSFYMQRGDTRYLKYIAGTLKRVLKSLHFFPEYRLFSDLIIDSGALDKKYESF
jgi:aminoglycoside/choline kinase family phosphotransferase